MPPNLRLCRLCEFLASLGDAAQEIVEGLLEFLDAVQHQLVGDLVE